MRSFIAALIILSFTSPLVFAEDQETARQMLESDGIPFTLEEFVNQAAKGDATKVKLFLDAGIDPDELYDKGDACCCSDQTALMAATEKGHIDVVRVLLDNGANPNIASENGETALMVAAEEGEADIVQILINRGAAVDARKEYGWTSLMLAAWEGSTDAARILLENGADPNAKGSEDSTALHYAAERDYKDIVILLLQYGADPNAKLNVDKDRLKTMGDFYNWTPLMGAIAGCRTCDMEIIKVLLDYGADVNQPTYHGTAFFALNWAGGGLEHGQEIFWELFKHDPDVNARSVATGRTLLMEAILGRWSDIDMIRAIIDKGADVNAQDKRGWTPLMHALVWSRPFGEDPHVYARLLMEKGAKVNPNAEDNPMSLILLRCSRFPDLAKYVLANGADINARDRWGKTAFASLAEGSDMNELQFFLANGADINAKENNGRTPLMHAATRNQPDTIRFLLKHGADISAKDAEGRTALIHAARNGSIDSVEVLLENNSEVNARDNLGMSARSHALFFNHPEIVEMLDSAGAEMQEGETRDRMKEEILSEAVEAHVFWESEPKHGGVSIHIRVENVWGEAINFEDFKLPAEIKVYTATFNPNGEDIPDKLIYSEEMVWSGVIEIPYDYLKEHLDLEFSDGDTACYGLVKVSLKIPDGRTIEAHYSGAFLAPESRRSD